jgi:hypothetical protein
MTAKVQHIFGQAAAEGRKAELLDALDALRQKVEAGEVMAFGIASVSVGSLVQVSLHHPSGTDCAHHLTAGCSYPLYEVTKWVLDQ